MIMQRAFTRRYFPITRISQIRAKSTNNFPKSTNDSNRPSGPTTGPPKPFAKGEKHPDLPLRTLSKAISYLLRHGGQEEGLKMRSDGYVRVRDLLQHPRMMGVNFQTLEELVNRDQKSRFHMRIDGDNTHEDWYIRANQGHSLPDVTALELEPIFASSVLPTAIHGTTVEAWSQIEKQGIHRMNRHHIHLASGFRQDGVISGIRHTSRILIYIDVQRALEDGLQFFLSRNRVILSPGDHEGYIRPKYFHRVQKLSRTIKEIPLDRDPII